MKLGRAFTAISLRSGSFQFSLELISHRGMDGFVVRFYPIALLQPCLNFFITVKSLLRSIEALLQGGDRFRRNSSVDDYRRGTPYCFVALKVTTTVADRSFQLSADIVNLKVFVTTAEPSNIILSVKLPWSVPP